MRKWTLSLLAAAAIFGSCSKGGNDNPPASSNTFTAKVDGKTTTFTVESATLLRSTADDAKRMDITGISADGKERVIITIGDKPATWDGVNVKDYAISLFEEDNPTTPEDESEGNDNGFVTYSSKTADGNWFTDAEAEHGDIVVSGCNNSSHTVSGTFNITYYTVFTTNVARQITDGKFENIKYTVLNWY